MTEIYKETIIIVGAGQAGASCCIKLRSLGFTGRLLLIGDEKAPPYQRPPLSKAYLTGEMDLERLYLRPHSFYDDNSIELICNKKVQKLDCQKKQVTLNNGVVIAYDKLVLATGSRPRPLPEKLVGAFKNIYYMRDLKDADALSEKMIAGKKVLVIGGGYIGLEGAAVAAQKGLHVCIIEAEDRILKRVACKETADFFRTLHQQKGVIIRENVTVEKLSGIGDTATKAHLSDGTIQDIDIIIAGIGILPNQELALRAGITVENGILVDEKGCTSNRDVFATGDCIRFPHRDGMIRLESVGHAIDHAHCVAHNLLGKEIIYQPKPWFWSDQYDVKLQIAGLLTGYDSVIKRLDNDSLSHWYYKENKLIAVDALNAPRAYMVAKRLIEAGLSPNIDIIADTQTDLKNLLK